MQHSTTFHPSVLALDSRKERNDASDWSRGCTHMVENTGRSKE